ncbi:ABC-type transport system, permease and ATPase components [Candidatus Scalindua japonica]|uniref:ABC-type transport system, permease and ATPase components n=1 Tax=Candidatus Scalindua japonica TaxID=1284222 RepID=A0A286U2W8_9BACT|nr:hypothetical protein [Candidatus Scalindua japonica]GAX62474.1 ABC-type transport system, permease and ATPase components [Candidatus Scalindua japonica]
MGDFFKKLDDIMTGDLVRKVGGLVCLLAVVLVGLGFLVGAKSVLSTMKGPASATVATDDAEQDEEDYEEEEDDDDEDEE